MTNNKTGDMESVQLAEAQREIYQMARSAKNAAWAAAIGATVAAVATGVMALIAFTGLSHEKIT